MQLVLKVTLSNNKAPQQTMQHVFNEGGGTIGRKLSNTWVLPDENRHLSGCHSEIEYENGSFYVVDTSTNGVFLNGEVSPIGKGNRKKFSNGDQLVMGTYAIQVEIKGEEQDGEELKPKLESDDLFADLLDEPEDVKNEIIEDLPIEKSFTNETIGSDDPFFQSGEFSLEDEIIPKKAIDDREDISDLDSFFKPPEVENKDISDDFFKIDDEEISVKEPEMENQSSVIPDDWNESNENSLDDFLTGINDPFKSLSDENDEKELEEIKADEKEDQDIQKETLIKEEANLGNINLEDKNTGYVNKDINKDLVSAFFEGMKLEFKPESSEFTSEDMLLAGALFRKSVEGTMEVLQSRAEIKNEMRMDMTTIQPIQNNPIKFSMTVEEAIKKLLLDKSTSQMDPDKAMDEAYDDIKSHQVAIISGIQASLTYVLKRFEPENLIERLERKNPISANIPVHRKAKLWEAFEELYETIEGEAEDDFNRLFGQEFAKAYDDQVAKLKKQRE